MNYRKSRIVASMRGETGTVKELEKGGGNEKERKTEKRDKE